jgi:protein-tyrosine phosphatase
MEIIPNLYLGNYKDSLYIDSFDIIINCTKNILFNDENKQNYRIPINDDPNDSIILNTYIDWIIYVIDNEIDNNKILVHCNHGQQRSPTIIACYLMSKYYWSLDYTIDFIKDKKKDAFFFQINFIDFLKKYEKENL